MEYGDHDDPPIANSHDYVEVSICFEDQEINSLFSALLKVRGVKTYILKSILDFEGSTKIVTEPQFFQAIEQHHRGKCLLVGNKDALRGLEALSLSRPLTEAKIEQAISQLLQS